jgi:hypothetical protein
VFDWIAAARRREIQAKDLLRHDGRQRGECLRRRAHCHGAAADMMDDDTSFRCVCHSSTVTALLRLRD